MISKITINDFRQFKNKEIYLAKRITILAGRNSTGKSTILGILANCAEIKKNEGTTYSGKQFRAEFSEIFHGSEKFDLAGSNRIRIDVVDELGQSVDYREFRTAWQNNDNKKRFRIIPFKKIDANKKTEAKMQFPVLYLGLSRLYPIGEAEKNNIESKAIKFSEESDLQWFKEKYKNILSINDEISKVDSFRIKETDKKAGVAIITDKYDELANSSGQDNLGQILMALLSFKKLKKTTSNWRGGLLLIDEVDSTLHPAAQKRLFDIMQKESERIGIQTIVTTHSSDLLKHVCSKTKFNNNSKVNEIEIYYFTNANRVLEIKRNISFPSIKNDLLIESMSEIDKLKVYSEDKENRWFLEKLLNKYLMYLDVLDINIGCEQLLNLYSADLAYFGNVLIVLDGDVKDEKINNLQQVNSLKNIIKLPGIKRPEEVIYNYLESLEPNHSFWEKGSELSITWQYINDNSPMSPRYAKYDKDREKYKNWFIDNLWWIDQCKVFDFWVIDNKELVDKFISDFINSYNSIASRNFYHNIKCINCE